MIDSRTITERLTAIEAMAFAMDAKLDRILELLDPAPSGAAIKRTATKRAAKNAAMLEAALLFEEDEYASILTPAIRRAKR